jgi:hypothetical protein
MSASAYIAPPVIRAVVWQLAKLFAAAGIRVYLARIWRGRRESLRFQG